MIDIPIDLIQTKWNKRLNFSLFVQTILWAVARLNHFDSCFFSRRNWRCKENVIEFDEEQLSTCSESKSLREFEYLERLVQNQEEVNTAGDNAEHVFKCADIYIDVDDGLCAVNLPANEGASTSRGRGFEFCDK